MLVIVICLLMEKKSLRLKPTRKCNFSTRFCLGSISNGFSNTDSREVSLNANLYDLSFDYNSIDKSGTLNIIKCLITKNNRK